MHSHRSSIIFNEDSLHDLQLSSTCADSHSDSVAGVVADSDGGLGGGGGDWHGTR